MQVGTVIGVAGQVLTIVSLLGIVWSMVRLVYNPESTATQKEAACGTALLLLQSGNQLQQEGRTEEALPLLESAARICECAGDWANYAKVTKEVASIYRHKAEAAREKHDKEIASDLYMRVRELSAAVGDKDGQLDALRASISLGLEIGRDRAISEYQELFDYIDKINSLLGVNDGHDWKADLDNNLRKLADDLLERETRRIHNQRTWSPTRDRLRTTIVYVLAGTAALIQVVVVIHSAAVSGR